MGEFNRVFKFSVLGTFNFETTFKTSHSNQSIISVHFTRTVGPMVRIDQNKTEHNILIYCWNYTGGVGGGWYSLCSDDRDDRRIF